MSKELKEQYAHLPHVKKVWVRGEDVYLAKVHGSVEVSLEEIEETKEKQKPGRKTKNEE